MRTTTPLSYCSGLKLESLGHLAGRNSSFPKEEKLFSVKPSTLREPGVDGLN